MKTVHRDGPLFGAAAYAKVLMSSLERLPQSPELTAVKVETFQIPHHGTSAKLNGKIVRIDVATNLTAIT